MSKITEHELYDDDSIKEATVVITIDGKDWETFRASKQMKAIREYVDEINRTEWKTKPISKEEAKSDDFVTFEEFQEEIKELRQEITNSAIYIGGRIGRQNNRLAAAIMFALLALTVAIYAVVKMR